MHSCEYTHSVCVCVSQHSLVLCALVQLQMHFLWFLIEFFNNFFVCKLMNDFVNKWVKELKKYLIDFKYVKYAMQK